jgi:hypothetical protein
MNAPQKGDEAYQQIQNSRLQKTEGFYETIKKSRLKMFGEVQNKSVKGTSKEIILKADGRLFGNIIIIAKNRQLDIHPVFSYPIMGRYHGRWQMLMALSKRRTRQLLDVIWKSCLTQQKIYQSHVQH